MVRHITACPHCGRALALVAIEEPKPAPSPTWPTLEQKQPTPGNVTDMAKYGYKHRVERLDDEGEGYQDSGDTHQP